MNRLYSGVISIMALLILSTCLSGQVGIPVFQNKRASYKDVLKEAKEKNTIALVVMYTEAIASNVIPRITGADTIKSNNNLITAVVDPYIQVNHPLIRRARPFNNPMWITIHPDNTIIGLSNSIVTNEGLSQFVRASKRIAQHYSEAKAQLNVDKNNMEAKKSLIEAMTVMYDSKKAQKHINKYIGSIGNPSREELEFVFKVAENCACGGKLEKFINKHASKLERVITTDRYLRLRQKFINTKLDEKGLLEPFYVWRAYEKDLGVHADSLFRLFAIGYFASIPSESEALINESIDYLGAYPDSPWELQDPLFNTVVNTISKKEDLELMLDLIGGQLFKEKTYRKLDYRALILYKLGQKDKALQLLSEVNEMAVKQGIRYKSLIYGLKK